MQFTDIRTERLRLVTITAEMMQADRASDRSQLAVLLNAYVPDEWPPENWEPHVFDFIAKLHAEHPETYGWTRYVVFGDPNVLMGTFGAFPRGSTEAEIGYSILPPWQRNGFATEATQAMIAELLRSHSLETISAQTFPHLTASRRVMERCGMTFAGPGDEEGTIRYRLEHSPSPPASGGRAEDAGPDASSPPRSTPGP